MLKKVIEIISNYQGIEPKSINEDSKLISDIGLSSFDVVSLVCEFEQEFGISIPDRDIKKFKIIKDVVDYIKDNS